MTKIIKTSFSRSSDPISIHDIITGNINSQFSEEIQFLHDLALLNLYPDLEGLHCSPSCFSQAFFQFREGSMLFLVPESLHVLSPELSISDSYLHNYCSFCRPAYMSVSHVHSTH